MIDKIGAKFGLSGWALLLGAVLWTVVEFTLGLVLLYAIITVAS